MLVNLVGLPDRKRVVQIFDCTLVWFTFVDQFICFFVVEIYGRRGVVFGQVRLWRGLYASLIDFRVVSFPRP
jgi:hypothetical protein